MQSADLGLDGPSFMPLQASRHAIPRFPSPVAVRLPIDVQLGPVRSVPAGTQHTLFLHAYGRVYALGSDAKGQCRGLHPAHRGRASCRLFVERKLPADPRGNALLSWRERARAAQQRGRRHTSPGTRERPARIPCASWISRAGVNMSCAYSSLGDRRRCGGGGGTSMGTWRLGHWTT